MDAIYDDPTFLPEILGRMAALGYEHVGNRGIEGREAFQASPALSAEELNSIEVTQLYLTTWLPPPAV